VWLREDLLIYSVLVDAQGWEGPLLYIFADSAPYIVGWLIAVAEHAFNMFRSFFSRSLLGEMFTSALYTQETMVVIGLGMSILWHLLHFGMVRFGLEGSNFTLV
jgi:hypothetical protein